MKVFRWFGWIFLALGIATLGLGAWLWFGGYDTMLAAGQLWFDIDSPSLNTTQAVIQRYVYAGLWDQIFVPLLQRPAWQAIAIVAAGIFVLAALFLAIGRTRHRYGFDR